MSRRFWIGLALAAPVVALEMGGHMIDLAPVVGGQASNWWQLALSTPVVLWAGWPFFTRAWASILNRSLNMFSLVALGSGAAWLYSIVGTLAPQLFPGEFRMRDGALPVYFEAAAVIIVLVLLGQVLELRAREKTSGAIRALLALAPKTTIRVGTDGTDESVALEAVVVGDALRIRPGEKVPVERHDRRRQRGRRRVHGDRRIDTRRQDADLARDRGHRQPDRQLRHAGRTDRRGHAARADRPHGRQRATQPGHRSSVWRIRWPDGSSRP